MRGQGDDGSAGAWRTRGALGIGTASLLSDAGHEVPTALLPSFLTATLGAPAAALGLIEGIADGAAGVARLAGGALADDPVRRRRSALGGYTATAVLSAAIGGATSVVQVGVLRAGAWSARGLRVPARNALLADAVPPGAYGRAYGFERAMDNVGAIIGPLLALGLVGLVGVRGAMLVSVVPGLLAVAAIGYTIRHTARAGTTVRPPLRLRAGPVLASPVRRLAPGIALFEVGNVAATLLILRATELLSPSLGADAATRLALVGYLVMNATATVASLVAGRVADGPARAAPTRVLAAGAGLFGLAAAGFAVVGPSAAGLVGAFAVAGAAMGAVETAEHTAIAVHAPHEVRGSAFGLLAAVQAGGSFVASALAGLLWTAAGAPVAFSVVAAVMLAATVALLSAARR